MWEYQTKVVVTKLRTFTKNHPRMFILWFCIENKQILISHYMTFILEFRLNTLQYLYDVWSLKNCLLNPAITFYSRNNTKSSKKHKINWSKKSDLFWPVNSLSLQIYSGWFLILLGQSLWFDRSEMTFVSFDEIGFCTFLFCLRLVSTTWHLVLIILLIVTSWLRTLVMMVMIKMIGHWTSWHTSLHLLILFHVTLSNASPILCSCELQSESSAWNTKQRRRFNVVNHDHN